MQLKTNADQSLLAAIFWDRALINNDVNIYLLLLKERDKCTDFLGLTCTNNFLSRIALPKRTAKPSSRLAYQIFFKVPFKDRSGFSASIVLNAISNHFPCVVNVIILNSKQLPPKPVDIREISIKRLKNLEIYRRQIFHHTIPTSW